jgi:hypothetical protein
MTILRKHPVEMTLEELEALRALACLQESRLPGVPALRNLARKMEARCREARVRETFPGRQALTA